MAFDPTDLLPMLPAQAGVCHTCHQPAGSFTRCWPCKEALQRNESLQAVPVLPISLASNGQALTNALWRYKEWDGADLYADDLAALLDDFGWRHGACLARQAGVNRFDSVTWVPSSKARPGQHPVVEILDSTRWANGRLVELLQSGGAGEAHQDPRADRFHAHRDACGQRVLVVDDTWTRGTNGLSAALSLLDVGATAVALLVIGRWFTEDRDEGTQHYVDVARTLGFDSAYCVFCDDRPNARAL